jgi:membrane-associated phospholipid phosphatase
MTNETETRIPAAGEAGAVERTAALLKHYRHIAWALATIFGILLFFAILPPVVRTILIRALQAQGYLATILIAFGLLSLSLLWAVGQRVDTYVFLHFNLRRRHIGWLDWLMLALTQLGNGAFAFGLALILFLVGERRIAYELALGTLTAWLVVEVVKASVRRPRPHETIEKARIVGYRETGRSYPSGHTTQAFFLVTLLVQYYAFPGWAVLVLYLVAGLVAVTRMYVGAHYPRDVLGGATLGMVWGLVWILIDHRFLIGRG